MSWSAWTAGADAPIRVEPGNTPGLWSATVATDRGEIVVTG